MCCLALHYQSFADTPYNSPLVLNMKDMRLRHTSSLIQATKHHQNS